MGQAVFELIENNFPSEKETWSVREGSRTKWMELTDPGLDPLLCEESRVAMQC